MMTTKPSPCAAPTCPLQATHAVYCDRAVWRVRKRPPFAYGVERVRYCRWHAVVQAVCRNAGEEVSHGLCA